MDSWITPKDLANGIFGFPKISITTQANLRARKKLSYTLVAHKVHYKKSWIEDYLNGNIRPAKTYNDNE